ncbi:MAG TPA: hypothetical protein VN397_01180 [Candidatus Methylomirabilis sp.]|nr:hypothetical protein [Candidatus Methylomirabilis sp.]
MNEQHKEPSRSSSCTQWADRAWWFGAPVLIAFITWGPYWIRNLTIGRKDWLRIPALAATVFDITAYLQPIGQAMTGVVTAHLIGPFAPLMRGIALAFPGASVPEAWFVARWITTTAALWIFAWCIERWSGLGRGMSRLLSLSFWIAFILVLGMKPGFASWLFPFGVFGMVAVIIIGERLEQRRIIPAIVWSAVALASSSLYAWYFLFVAVWLGATWFLWLVKNAPRIASALAVLGSVSASAFAIMFARWVTGTPEGIVWIELTQRLSLSYTHMIFLSGSVLLTILWTALFGALYTIAGSETRRRIEVTGIAWLSLLLTFFHSPFTGHYIQNDHFRSAAAILSWFGLAVVWSVVSRGLTTHDPSAEVALSRAEGPGTGSRRARLIPYLACVISLAYVIRILAAPYAWNRDFLNVLQLTHWFALLVASWLAIRWMHAKKQLDTKTFGTIVLFGSLVIGGNAIAATYTYEFKNLPKIETLVPVFDWVKTNVPSNASLCADHGGDAYSLDDMIAAHTGRVVHVAHTTLYHRERDAAYLDRMRTVAAFYDVRSAGDEEYWRLQSSLNQFIVCEQYPVQTRLFKAFGLSQNRIDALTGCPRATIDARWKYVKDAIDQPHPDAAAFERICPYVAIPVNKNSFWHLPEGYREIPVTDDVSIFAAPS